MDEFSIAVKVMKLVENKQDARPFQCGWVDCSKVCTLRLVVKRRSKNYRVSKGNLTFRGTTEYTLMRDNMAADFVTRVSSSGALLPFISERIQAKSLTNALILAVIDRFLM